MLASNCWRACMRFTRPQVGCNSMQGWGQEMDVSKRQCRCLRPQRPVTPTHQLVMILQGDMQAADSAVPSRCGHACPPGGLRLQACRVRTTMEKESLSLRGGLVSEGTTG